MKEELEKRFPNHSFDFHSDHVTHRQFVAMDGTMIETSWEESDLEIPAVKEAILEALISYVVNYDKIH